MGVADRFPALRHRNFRRYAVAQAISLSGFWMQSVAQGWLVYRLSDSAFVLGLVGSASQWPILFISPVAGVIADRFPKVRIIRITQALSIVIAATLGVLVACDVATVGVVAAAALALGAVGAVDLPTRQAFIAEMVGPDDVPAAIALNASIFNTARVVGPALAGLLVGVLGEAPCFFLNGASYAALLLALRGMAISSPAAMPPRATGESLRAGLRYVRGRRLHVTLLVGVAVIAGFALQANVLMPVVAARTFGRAVGGYGLLLTAFGIGAMLSALMLASRRHTVAEHRRNLVGGATAFGLGQLGVALAPTYAAALACQGAAGFGLVRFTATANGVLQQQSHERVRGRVMAFHTVMFAGTAPIGGIVLGAIAESAGPRMAVTVAGLAALTIAAWCAWRLPAAALEHDAEG